MYTNNKTELTTKYNKGVIIIHWISALLIFALFPMGKYMSDIPIIDKITLIKIHSVLGFLVFLLTIARSILYFTKERPERLSTGSKANDLLAKVVQSSFYFLLFAISISGSVIMVYGGYIDVLMSSGAIPELIIPREEIGAIDIHNILATIMMILVAMHIVGVFRYNAIHKTNIIKRIL